MVDAEHKDLNRVHPLDSAHWKWSEDPRHRDTALNLMVQARINVINMSSWGEDFLTCAWTTAASPMQTDTKAHDELFEAAMDKPLLIAPFIETRGGDFPWTFRGEFPYFSAGTISQITNLIDRYLKNPAHPEWAQKWVRIYDQFGEERHAVVIIHAASDQLSNAPLEWFRNETAFADGFDFIADEVLRRTGVKIGFFIDALPLAPNAPGVFKPSPESSGPPSYHALRLLLSTTERGWQVVRVAPWARDDWDPLVRDEQEKEIAAYVGSSEQLTLVGLDTRGRLLNTASGETPSYSIGGLAPSTRLNLAIWNASGDGRTAAATEIVTSAAGVARFTVPLHAAFALTTVDVH
jgi:hypothetical protein